MELTKEVYNVLEKHYIYGKTQTEVLTLLHYIGLEDTNFTRIVSYEYNNYYNIYDLYTIE